MVFIERSIRFVIPDRVLDKTSILNRHEYLPDFSLLKFFIKNGIRTLSLPSLDSRTLNTSSREFAIAGFVDLSAWKMGSCCGAYSLGEISALVSNKCLKFEDGLELVHKRALAMQKACEETPSTMAAILGLEDIVVEKICSDINGIVVPANYNCPGQLVISGEMEAVDIAIEKLTESGARRAIKLPVGGAFHSPIMKSAKSELKSAIDSTSFSSPICPIYQNVCAEAVIDPEKIKQNLIDQLTSPVKWTQTMLNIVKNQHLEVIEVGPGKVLQGLFKKIDRKINTSSAEI